MLGLIGNLTANGGITAYAVTWNKCLLLTVSEDFVSLLGAQIKGMPLVQCCLKLNVTGFTEVHPSPKLSDGARHVKNPVSVIAL